jgi:hypothetical protein
MFALQVTVGTAVALILLLLMVNVIRKSKDKSKGVKNSEVERPGRGEFERVTSVADSWEDTRLETEE